MTINNMDDALSLVGKQVRIKSAKHFSDKRLSNYRFLKNVYANFQNRKCEVLNYINGKEGKYKFEVFNGKKVCNFYNEDFELINVEE